MVMLMMHEQWGRSSISQTEWSDGQYPSIRRGWQVLKDAKFLVIGCLLLILT
jgi:hypothetical protein